MYLVILVLRNAHAGCVGYLDYFGSLCTMENLLCITRRVHEFCPGGILYFQENPLGEMPKITTGHMVN